VASKNGAASTEQSGLANFEESESHDTSERRRCPPHACWFHASQDTFVPKHIEKPQCLVHAGARKHTASINILFPPLRIVDIDDEKILLLLTSQSFWLEHYQSSNDMYIMLLLLLV
jgi:hypothetical protein